MNVADPDFIPTLAEEMHDCYHTQMFELPVVVPFNEKPEHVRKIWLGLAGFALGFIDAARNPTPDLTPTVN